jgi:hypothetical protein
VISSAGFTWKRDASAGAERCGRDFLLVDAAFAVSIPAIESRDGCPKALLEMAAPSSNPHQSGTG